MAPSYNAFLGCATGYGVDWQCAKFAGSPPNIADLVAAAATLAGEKPSVVAIDMPLSRAPITGRREADRAISKTFGGRGCSTHSPSPDRPGPLSVRVKQDLDNAGYVLATTLEEPDAPWHAIEVYPHPALLALLNGPYRVPYKVSKSHKYWPDATRDWRTAKLIEQFASIESALRGAFGETRIPLPAQGVLTFAQLKRYEDALDALICAWVGVKFLEHSASPHGDEAAAIWVPV